jgi:GNAT superfamily N-acetyltransferase
MNQQPVMQLNEAHRAALQKHFQHLAGADLRLRFGHAVKREWLTAYVNSLNFEEDAVFGVFCVCGDDLELVGVAHLALYEDAAEFGVSVMPEYRGKGIGKALFARASAYAQNRLVKTFFMHCLGQNAAMMHIARSSGMQIVRDASDADAWLELPRSNSASLADELLAKRVALFDFALKSQVSLARSISRAIVGKRDDQSRES